MRGSGGTPGGLATFLLGVALAGIGIYMVFSRVIVHAQGWSLWGFDASGAILVVFMLGLGFLFFDSRSPWGWALLIGSLAWILLYLILTVSFHFISTNLLTFLLMLAFIGAGLGLVFRSFRSAPAKEDDQAP